MSTWRKDPTATAADPAVADFDFYRILPKKPPGYRYPPSRDEQQAEVDFNDTESVRSQVEHVFSGKQNDYLVFPSNPDKIDVRGVSHFTLNESLSRDANTRALLRNPKYSLRKIHAHTVLPEGLGVRKQRSAVDINGFSTSFGVHVTVFATRKMPLTEFTEKLYSMYWDVDEEIEESDESDGQSSIRGLHNAIPSFPEDGTLYLVSKALFEMSLGDRIAPDRALRSLMFHFRLAEKDFLYENLLEQGVLSEYVAEALENSFRHQGLPVAISPAPPRTLDVDCFRIFPKTQVTKTALDMYDWDAIRNQLETEQGGLLDRIDVFPANEHEKEIRGVSHFTMSDTLSEDIKVKQIFRNYTWFRIARGTVLPEGLDFRKDAQACFSPFLGHHVGVFATRKMPVKEFTQKLFSVYSRINTPSEETVSNVRLHQTEPVYPEEKRLRHVSKALFEMSLNAQVPPDRALRSLVFHNRLAESGFSYEQLLTGDALSIYAAEALERCANTYSYEEAEDRIRMDLNRMVDRKVRLRDWSDYSDCSDEEREPNPYGKLFLLLGTRYSGKTVYVWDDNSTMGVSTDEGESVRKAVYTRPMYDLLKKVYRRGLAKLFVLFRNQRTFSHWDFCKMPLPFERDVEIERMLDICRDMEYVPCCLITAPDYTMAFEADRVRQRSANSMRQMFWYSNYQKTLAAPFFAAGIRNSFDLDSSFNTIVSTAFRRRKWTSWDNYPGVFAAFHPVFGTAREVRSTCHDLNEHIAILKKELWNSSHHSMVVCFAGNRPVDLKDILPGDEEINQRQRLALLDIAYNHYGNIVAEDDKFHCDCFAAVLVVCVNAELFNEVQEVVEKTLSNIGLLYLKKKSWEERKYFNDSC